MKTAIVIGSGFAGLSAACCLAQEGLKVRVLEKNETLGGRARSFSAHGFTWDMGPSWYWMPDVFENFFARFGKQPSDYYDLIRLNPSYRVFWEDEAVNVPADLEDLKALFEQYESGAGNQLEVFLGNAQAKYNAAMKELVFQPGQSILEFVRMDVVRAALKLDLFHSVETHARKHFQHQKLLQLVEFPILFLGALPKNTPSMYSLMNYADMVLGTWYPMGGMIKIVHAMEQLALSLGVTFETNAAVERFDIKDQKIIGVNTANGSFSTDVVVAACDYHHTESLLPKSFRNYQEPYWASRDMAPSSLLFYIGVGKKLEGLEHHNLFFDTSFPDHADALYTHPKWPDDPLMYVCVTSKTDPSTAPENCENLFVLIPTAPGLKDTESIRNHYFNLIVDRLEAKLRTTFRSDILFFRSYAGSDFTTDYNAYRGNAYGLANTLRQTAVLKPSIRNKKLSNLFYSGQLTVPGPGVPPAIISGQIAAKLALKSIHHSTQNHSL